ncbi:MAG: Omp28-related outer membrane protein [Omnitrophica WOR_2 bacterium]
MKKIYLFLTAMLFTCLSYGQVYLFEDFGSGTWPPTGWTVLGVPAQWSNSASNTAGGTAPEAKFTYVQQNTTSRLVSPLVDLTGVDNVTLTFKHYYDWYATGPKIGVAYRFGTGGTWTSAWETTPSGNQGPKTQVINLTGVGQADFQFCIYITGNLYNVDYWFLDNIKLFIPLNLDAALGSVNIPKYVESGAAFNVEGIVTNEGLTPINSFDVSYTVDNGEPQTYSVTGLNIALGSQYYFIHPDQISIDEIGTHQVVTSISNINGGQDLDPLNNSITSNVGVVAFLPAKKVMAEEATGTWCGWCVRGICFMDYMAETYPETWIGVAVHNGDPMVVTAYDNAIDQIIPGFAGYPSVTTDRTAGESDPSELEAAYERRINAVSPATITIENYAYNAETREIAFDLESEFVADINSELRFGVVFVEDSLYGTASGWNQSNYYAGGGNGAMCGFESLPGTIPAAQMHYDHVARQILDTPFGTEGSLPLTIAAGSVIDYHYSFVLPSAWNYDNLHIVGFLLDMSTKEILNANNVINSFVGITSPSFDNKVKVYPNPAGDFSNVTFYMEKSGKATIELYDTFGKLVNSISKDNFATGENIVRVNTSTLTNGMYVMKLTVDNHVVSKKLSVIK